MTWLWGALINLSSTVTQWLIHASVPAWLFVGVAAVTFGLGKWGLPGHDQPRVETDTVYAEGPLELPDLPEPTPPDQVTEYDSSDTQTQCVQVPTWLASTENERYATTSESTTRRGGRRDTLSSRGVIGQSPETLPAEIDPPIGSPTSDGPRYAITPLIDGSPTLSVGAERVTLSSYVRGQGRTWTYEVPKRHWAISTEGAISYAQELGTGAQSIGSNLNLGLSYTEGRWSVRGAAGLATTVTENKLGMGAVAEVSITRTVLRW